MKAFLIAWTLFTGAGFLASYLGGRPALYGLWAGVLLGAAYVAVGLVVAERRKWKA